MAILGQRPTPGLVWRISSACPNQATCVAVAALPDGGAAMRDTKEADGPELRFSAPQWASFVTAVKEGAFTPSAG